MIINSLLDTDLYKFTMQQAILHQFPGAMVEYKFKCRNKSDQGQYKDEIIQEVNNLCNLRFTEPELKYLSKLDYIYKNPRSVKFTIQNIIIIVYLQFKSILVRQGFFVISLKSAKKIS